MQAVISTPPGTRAGFAVIVIQDAPPLAGEPVFRILSTGGDWLSPGGWQKNRIDLRPAQWGEENGSLRLEVGPDVVDWLDPQDVCRIELGDARCVMIIRDIIPSPMAGGSGMASMSPAASRAAEEARHAEEERRMREAEEAEAARRAEEERLAAETRKRGEAEAKARSEDAAVERAFPPPEPKPVPVVEGRRSLWPPALAALLLLLIALAAWFWLHGGNIVESPPLPERTAPAPDVPAPPVAAPESEPMMEPRALPERKAAPSEAAPKPPADPRADVRSLLLGSPAAPVARDAGIRLRAPDADAARTEAAFLALEYAAEKGDAEAMLLAGQFYDPLSPLPRGSLEPDMAEAHRWYAAAKDRGQPQAAAALDALRGHVEQKAREGDAEAARLLRSW